jgi:hypothetical protein
VSRSSQLTVPETAPLAEDRADHDALCHNRVGVTSDVGGQEMPGAGIRLGVQCADVLESHADEMAELVSRENGKPIVDARNIDITILIGEFRFY